MKNKHKASRALSQSVFHMSASIKRMIAYESSRSKVDETYAIFQQLLALYYEAEAIGYGLESVEMNKFMRQFYGE